MRLSKRFREQAQDMEKTYISLKYNTIRVHNIMVYIIIVYRVRRRRKTNEIHCYMDDGDA